MQNDIVKQPPKTNEEPSTTEQPTQPLQPSASAPTVVDVMRPSSTASTPAQLGNENATLEDTQSSQEEQSGSKPPAVVNHVARKPIGVIVTAVVICTGLVGGVIYAGMQKSDKGSNVATQTQPNASQNTVAPAAEARQEIDAAITETDSLQESAPDLSSELSDASLGL